MEDNRIHDREGGENRCSSNIAQVAIKKPHRARNLIIVAIAIVSIFGICSYAGQFVTVPDVRGMTVEEADNAIDLVSDKWETTYHIEEGQMNALMNMYYASGREVGDLVVTDTYPAVGTSLNREDEEREVQLVVRLSDNELAKLRKQRKKAIKSEVSDSLKNGFSKETYQDNDIYILYRAYEKEDSDQGSWEDAPADFAEANESLYKKLARKTGSSIVCGAYTKDGYLLGIAVTVHANATKAEKNRVISCAKKLRESGETYARKHSKQYLRGLLASWKKSQDSNTGGYYRRLSGNRVVVYLKSSYSDPVWIGDAEERDSTRAYWKARASWSAQMLRQKITIKMLNSAGEVWDSFSANPPRWPKFS